MSIDASFRMSSPASTLATASATISRVAWMAISASAIHHWMACLLASFSPNTSRSWTCSHIIWRARSAKATAMLPISRRREVSRCCIGAYPCPTSPSTWASGIRMSSKTSS